MAEKYTKTKLNKMTTSEKAKLVKSILGDVDTQAAKTAVNSLPKALYPETATEGADAVRKRKFEVAAQTAEPNAVTSIKSITSKPRTVINNLSIKDRMAAKNFDQAGATAALENVGIDPTIAASSANRTQQYLASAMKVLDEYEKQRPASYQEAAASGTYTQDELNALAQHSKENILAREAWDQENRSSGDGAYDTWDNVLNNMSGVSDDYLKYIRDTVIPQNVSAIETYDSEYFNNAQQTYQDATDRNRAIIEAVTGIYDGGNENTNASDRALVREVFGNNLTDSEVDTILSQIHTDPDAFIQENLADLGTMEQNIQTAADYSESAPAYDQLGEDIDTELANREAYNTLMSEAKASPTYEQDKVFTPVETGRANGYSSDVNTLYMWLNDPDFKYKYEIANSFSSTQSLESTFNNKGYEYMTDEEIAGFNAAYAQGEEAAERYLSSLNATGVLNRRRAEAQVYSATNLAETHGFLAYNAALGTNLASDVLAIPQVVAAATGINTDPNSSLYDVNRFTESVRGRQQQMVGESGILATPILGTTLGTLAYNGMTALLDNMIARGVSGAWDVDFRTSYPQAVSAINQILMSSGAASNTLYSELQNGTSNEGAVAKALASGFIEALTEKYSLEALLSESESTFQHIWKNFIAEGSEEMASDILNPIADAVISGITGDQTELMREYEGYILQGYSKQDATKMVLSNFLQEMTVDGLIGGFVGSASGASVAIQAEATGSQIKKSGSTSKLVEIAEKMPEGSQSRKYADAVKRTGSNYATARLYSTLMQDLDSASQETVTNIAAGELARDLRNGGETGDSETVARNILKVYNGETLTEAERSTILNSKRGAEIMDKASLVSSRDSTEMKAYNEAYAAGFYGRESTKNMNQTYYQAGVKAAQAAEQKRLAAVGTGKAGTGSVSYIGTVVSDADISKKNAMKIGANTFTHLEEQQQVAAAAIQDIAKATSLNFVLYEGQADDSGAITIENGKYEGMTNTLYIDLNSGKNRSGQGVIDYTIMQTVAHETTHFIARNSKSGYATLQNLVRKTLEERGQDFDELVREKIRISENSGVELTREAAVEEVMANASEMMLKDTKVFQQLAQKNKSLVEKVKTFVSDLLSKIRKALGKVGAQHPEAKALIEAEQYVAGLQEAWDAALVEALETMKAGKTSETGEAVETWNGIPVVDKFELREPVEKKGNLVATHAVSTENLMRMLDEGTMVGISVAVAQADNRSSSAFGDNTLVFYASAIDPEANPDNHIFGFDAWTPRRPKAIYQKNESAIQQARETYVKTLQDSGVDAEIVKSLEDFFDRRLEEQPSFSNSHWIETKNGTLRNVFAEAPSTGGLNNIGIAALYALDAGLTAEDINEVYHKNARGLVEAIQSNPQMKEGLQQLVSKITSDFYEDRIFQKGVTDTNERSDSTLADITVANTTDNVLDVMKQMPLTDQFDSEGAEGIRRKTPLVYNTLDEVRNDQGRLSADENVSLAALNETDNAIWGFKDEVSFKNQSTAKIEGILQNAAANNQSISDTVRALWKAGYIKANKKNVGKVMEAIQSFRHSPTNYFEAKLMRNSSFSEVAAAVVRESSTDLISRLKENGFRVLTYDGTLNDRIAKVNSVNEAKFSLRESEALASTNVQLSEDGDSAYPTAFSLRTWNESDYKQNVSEAAKALSKELGVSERKAKKWINDVNSIAKYVADHKELLDYEANEFASAIKSNTEYGNTLDFSTLCPKRLITTGTFDAIQRAMPDTVLTQKDIFRIRNMLVERNIEVACGSCYVESTRKKMGEYANRFLTQYKETNPDWVPNMVDLNTVDGLDAMHREHPEAYDAYTKFMSRLAQRKPKMFEKRTEYRGEILKDFSSPQTVAKKNLEGGFRVQSYSDFEIVHMLDMMQAVMDMSRVGLASQGYTKVPAFAWIFGDTGVKINLSMFAKGVDENGKLVYDEVDGMKLSEAQALRDRYSKNVGTVLVVFSDEQLKAAMADDFVDYIIPFHRSQWSKRDYESLGLSPKTRDYTLHQSEKWATPHYNANGKKQTKPGYNISPNSYWDFSKSGKQNAETYLRMCAEEGKKPKFAKYLVNNGDGSYSLQPDGSTDGYWKLLIDFKMYDNNGKGSPQLPVKPTFNMEQANRLIREYKGGHNSFPVAQEVVDEFVAEKKSQTQAKFALRNPVETDGDLIAVHNLSAQNLFKMLTNFDGIPMPSIAVYKAYMKNEIYGNVSVVFGKETIDPEANEANRVYGNDAFTAEFPWELRGEEHPNVTADEIVQMMLQMPENGDDDDAFSMMGRTAKRYESIDDIRNDSDRLNDITGYSMHGVYESLNDLYESLDAVDISEIRDVNKLLVKAAQEDMYAEDIETLFADAGYSLDEDIAQQARDTIDYMQNIPTNYFEAKPRRVVGFDEIRMVLYPQGTSSDLIDLLNERGIPNQAYTDKKDRVAKLNNMDDVKFSPRTETESDLTRQYLESMEITDSMNESEKWLLGKYQRTQQEIAEKESQIAEQDELKVKATTPEDRTKAENRAKILRDQVKRLRNAMRTMERSDGFGGLMRRSEDVVKRYMQYSDVTQATDLSDQLNADLNSLNSQLESAVKTIQSTEGAQRAMLAKGMLNEQSLTQAGKNVRATFGTRMSGKDISNRLALAYAELYAAEGEQGAKNFARVMRDLAEDVLRRSNRRYQSATLDDLRENLQGSISLTDAQKQELKNAGISQSEFKRVMSGVVNVSDSGTSLASIVSNAEYYGSGIISQIASTDSEGDMILKLYNLVSEEKAKERSFALDGMSETDSINYTMAEIMSTSNIQLAVDQNTMDAIQTAMKQGSETNQKVVSKIDAAMKGVRSAKITGEQLWKSAANADQTARQALEYYRAIDEQRRILEEKEIVQQLKSDAAQKFRTDRAIREINRKTSVKENKIRRTITRLNNLITNESDYKNVPEHLKAFVGEVVETFGSDFGAIVFSGKKADEIIATYERLKTVDDSFMNASYDEDMAETLRALKEWAVKYQALVTGKKKNRMEHAQLRALIVDSVNDIVDSVKTLVDNSTEMRVNGRKQKFATIANSAISEMMERPDHTTYQNKLGDTLSWMERAIVTGNTTPVYFFDQMGNKQFKNLFKDFQRGAERWAFISAHAKQAIAEMKKQYKYNSWVGGKALTFTTQQGYEITLDKEQALWMYATWKREHSNPIAATEHLTKGGFVYEGRSGTPAKKTRLGTKAAERTTGYLINEQDMQTVHNYLTEQEKGYADAMVNFISTEMGALGNEVSMELYGIRKFKEGYYFPYAIVQDQKFQKSADGGGAVTNDSRIKHASFTHALTQGANTALVMGNFTDVVANHIGQMANYASMTLPIENMNRVLNYRFDSQGGNKTTMRSLIRQKYGSNTLVYMQRFLRDVNGGVRGADKSAFQKTISLFKKSAVVASMSVSLQQTSAMLRAGAMMNYKYLLQQPLHYKKEYNQLMEHSGVAIIKQMGRFDTNVGQSYTEWLSSPEDANLNLWGKIKNRSEALVTSLPNTMDEVAWGMLWKAVKSEQADLHPNMDKTSNEFLDMCGERFNDIAYHTQVFDSTLSRSQLMRSTNTIDQMATAFRAEPTLTLNVMYDAFFNKNIPKGERAKRRASALSAVMLSSIAAAFGSAMISAWGDDDDDRTAAEKIVRTTNENFWSNLLPWYNIPYISDIVSLLEGYDVERADMSLFQDVVNGFNKVQQWRKGNTTWYRALEEFGGSLANFLGVPAKNIMRDLRRVYNMAHTRWEKPTQTGMEAALMPDAAIPGWEYDTSTTAYYDRLVSAYVKGDTVKAKDIETYIQTVGGKDAKQIRDGVKAAVGDRFESGTMTETDGIKLLYKLYGKEKNYDKDSLYFYFDKLKDKMSGKLQKGDTYSKFNDLYTAVETGKNLQSEINELTSHGTAKKDIASAITRKYSETYVSLYKTNKKKAADLQSRLLTAYVQLGYNRSDKIKDIQQWVENDEKKNKKTTK